MFDVGFWELALIGVIALIVVGPDRLPGMARTVGFWIGRARRYVDQVRRDVEREIHAEELRNAIHGKGGLDDLYQAVDETRSAVREIESDFQRSTDDAADQAVTGGDPTGADEAGASAGAARSEGTAAGGTAAEEPDAPPGTTAAPAADGAASSESGSERAPGESDGPWTEGIRVPVQDPSGAEPATSSAEAEPEPRRDERRENHG